MAQLKDLLVNGDARILGTLRANEATQTIPGLMSIDDKKFIDCLEMREIVFAESTDSFGGSESEEFLLAYPLTVGDVYIVNWDGVPYFLEAKTSRDASNGELVGDIIVGNMLSYVPGLEGLCPDTGEPFCVAAFEETPSTIKFVTPNAGTHIASIKKCVDTAFMRKNNPTGVGSFSLNRKQGTAIGSYSFAEGSNTTASSAYCHAEGYNTIASASGSHSEGHASTASGSVSHAEGYQTTASGDYSHAEGNSTTASGSSSHAEGESTTASGNYSHAEGFDTTASGDYSHVEGFDTTASDNSSHAEGGSTTASGVFSHAEGRFTKAIGDQSHAEGYMAIAYGSSSHAEGHGATISVTITGKANATTYTLSSANSNIKAGQVIYYGGTYRKITAYNSSAPSITVSSTLSTIALSSKSATIYRLVAFGDYSHAEGYNTTAPGNYSHAEGYNTTASGNYSHAEGEDTTASGSYSHAEGTGTIASGLYGSHAEGYNTTASGKYGSHAEGRGTTASGDYSHAEGNSTTASGSSSHAEGNNTTASGSYSHAENRITTASGDYSHAEGYYTTANSKSQHVQGEYNILDTANATARGTYAHIVGNGTSTSARSNAHTLDWSGNAWFAGTITGTSVYGAVYNDYAEYRKTTEEITAGRVVVENGDDTLSISTKRMMPGAEIVSDTFGFAIGKNEECQTPIAVAGRVLAYTFENRNSYKPGDAVCSGPNGTVSKMTREEIKEFPERIIGTVSAIPTYEVWGSNNVKVDGRIWIKVR